MRFDDKSMTIDEKSNVGSINQSQGSSLTLALLQRGGLGAVTVCWAATDERSFASHRTLLPPGWLPAGAAANCSAGIACTHSSSQIRKLRSATSSRSCHERDDGAERVTVMPVAHSTLDWREARGID